MEWASKVKLSKHSDCSVHITKYWSNASLNPIEVAGGFPIQFNVLRGSILGAISISQILLQAI